PRTKRLMILSLRPMRFITTRLSVYPPQPPGLGLLINSGRTFVPSLPHKCKSVNKILLYIIIFYIIYKYLLEFYEDILLVFCSYIKKVYLIFHQVDLTL